MAIPISSAAAEVDMMSCGSLENAYGPFDYTNPTHRMDKLPIVETYHFGREQQMLIRDESTHRVPARVLNDLDYTLRAFPNHHQALATLLKLAAEDPVAAGSLRYGLQCYFVRAIQFQPRDQVAHMLYGTYFVKMGDVESALREYNAALAIDEGYAETHYNLGLLLLDLGRPEKALEHAKKAYALGFPLPGLKRRLERLGLSMHEESATTNR